MKKYRFKLDYVLYFLVFAVALTLGLLFLLQKDTKQFVENGVGYIIGAGILIYAVAFLAPNLLKKRNAVVKGFMIAEFVLVVLMALGIFIPQIHASYITESRAIGLTIWARGFVEIVRGYYHLGDMQVAGKKSAYDRAAKYIHIFLITFGTYVFFNVQIDKKQIVFYLAISLLICAGIFFLLGLYCLINKDVDGNGERVKKEKKPKKIKQEKNKTEKKEEPKEEPKEE